jgi:hypothetical protein
LRRNQKLNRTRADRLSVPDAGRMSINTEVRGTHAQIEELRILNSTFRRRDWVDDGWEPGLSLVALTLTIEPRKVRLAERVLACVSLHALGRRYERGQDSSDAAVMSDLHALARVPRRRTARDVHAADRGVGLVGWRAGHRRGRAAAGGPNLPASGGGAGFLTAPSLRGG